MVDYSYKPSDYTIDANSAYFAVSNMPKFSKWQCHLTEGPYGLILSVSEGKEPNWFHRKMQELCFGFKWRKTK